MRAAPTESGKGSQTPLVRVTGTYNLPMWVLGATGPTLQHLFQNPSSPTGSRIFKWFGPSEQLVTEASTAVKTESIGSPGEREAGTDC